MAASVTASATQKNVYGAELLHVFKIRVSYMLQEKGLQKWRDKKPVTCLQHNHHRTRTSQWTTDKAHPPSTCAKFPVQKKKVTAMGPKSTEVCKTGCTSTYRKATFQQSTKGRCGGLASLLGSSWEHDRAAAGRCFGRNPTLGDCHTQM
jgi:hypothetical protein